MTPHRLAEFVRLFVPAIRANPADAPAAADWWADQGGTLEEALVLYAAPPPPWVVRTGPNTTWGVGPDEDDYLRPLLVEVGRRWAFSRKTEGERVDGTVRATKAAGFGVAPGPKFGDFWYVLNYGRHDEADWPVRHYTASAARRTLKRAVLACWDGAVEIPTVGRRQTASLTGEPVPTSVYEFVRPSDLIPPEPRPDWQRVETRRAIDAVAARVAEGAATANEVRPLFEWTPGQEPGFRRTGRS